ncbi:unnamed protein product [Adineta steineri]|uniref:PX domain-containing protein n=2 Tax=Adineta steineri TaxID=433720 RepID=A0A814C5V4_9BILA|nr:unnamed protein product [Adineta steineri]
MSTFTNSNNNYPNLDVFNSNNNVAKSSFPPPYDQHQYMNPNTYNNWQAPEQPAWQAPEQPAWQAPSSPSYQLNEEKFTKPTQPLIFPMDLEINSTNTRTISDNSHDGYITIVDIESTPGLIPNMNSNSLYKRNSASDQSEELYEIIPKTPGSMLSNTNFVHKFSFDFPKTSTIQQQTTPFDDYLIPTSIQQQTPAYISIDNDLSRLNRTDTTNTITPSVSVEPLSLIDSYDLTSTKLQIATSMPESTIASLKKKKKRNFAGFLTLSRKSKNINPRETTGQAGKRDTDSDDSFSDSEYPPHSSNNQNAPTLKTNSGAPQESRTSLAGFENTKAPPRARFFDKHGLDSYLLNGTKGKSSDEHVEITFDDREGGVCWAPNITIPPFTCKIEEPSKGTKLGGLKAFMEYKIQAQTPGSRIVGRRYKQFDWLHEQLVNKFRFICIPPLPGKQIAGRFEQEFIEERRRQLELWLNRICRHPVLCASFPVQHFVTCELTEKHNKDWKAGKRRIEKDDFREASWLQCVSLKNTGLSDSNIVSQIDTFSQQQPGLESQLKNLSQGLTKYVERHTEVYERDIQRIGELYSKVHQAVQLDTKTPVGCDNIKAMYLTKCRYVDDWFLSRLAHEFHDQLLFLDLSECPSVGVTGLLALTRLKSLKRLRLYNLPPFDGKEAAAMIFEENVPGCLVEGINYEIETVAGLLEAGETQQQQDDELHLIGTNNDNTQHPQDDKTRQSVQKCDSIIQQRQLMDLGCDNIKAMYLTKCRYVDDWFLSRLAHEFHDQLLFLDLSECPSVGVTGLLALTRLKSLKRLRLYNLPPFDGKEAAAMIFEENVPGCLVEGINYEIETVAGLLEAGETQQQQQDDELHLIGTNNDNNQHPQDDKKRQSVQVN